MAIVDEVVVANATPLHDLGVKYTEIRAKRLAVKKDMDALKAEEDELSAKLLMSMEASKLPEFRIQNGPKLITRVSPHLEFIDQEVFYRFILQRAVECLKSGLAPSTAFSFLNKTPNKAGVTAFLETFPEFSLEQLGLKSVDVTTLSVNK